MNDIYAELQENKAELRRLIARRASQCGREICGQIAWRYFQRLARRVLGDQQGRLWYEGMVKEMRAKRATMPTDYANGPAAKIVGQIITSSSQSSGEYEARMAVFKRYHGDDQEFQVMLQAISAYYGVPCIGKCGSEMCWMCPHQALMSEKVVDHESDGEGAACCVATEELMTSVIIKTYRKCQTELEFLLMALKFVSEMGKLLGVVGL